MCIEYEMENNKNCFLGYFIDFLKFIGFIKNVLVFFCFKVI